MRTRTKAGVVDYLRASEFRLYICLINQAEFNLGDSQVLNALMCIAEAAFEHLGTALVSQRDYMHIARLYLRQDSEGLSSIHAPVCAASRIASH